MREIKVFLRNTLVVLVVCFIFIFLFFYHFNKCSCNYYKGLYQGFDEGADMVRSVWNLENPELLSEVNDG